MTLIEQVQKAITHCEKRINKLKKVEINRIFNKFLNEPMSKNNITKVKNYLDALFGSKYGNELLWKFIKVK